MVLGNQSVSAGELNFQNMSAWLHDWVSNFFEKQILKIILDNMFQAHISAVCLFLSKSCHIIYARVLCLIIGLTINAIE